jgi:hypothetical protein
LTDEERARLQALRQFRSTGSGYGAIQSTRPQTLAYGLTDSPAGQLAWITEKFGEWTDGGLPDEAVNRDQLLTNVMLYWLTGTAGSSARLYYETAHRVWQPAAWRAPGRGWPEITSPMCGLRPEPSAATIQWPAASAALTRALTVNTATRAPAAKLTEPARRPAT